MSTSASELAAALDRVAVAMDAETAALRSGTPDALATAAERKRLVIEAALAVWRQRERLPDVASRAERARLELAARRLQAAAERNGATLQGALEGTRRLFACLAEAARAAASTGTYGPDGSRRRSDEAAGTISRSA
jgi:flagellar biosynthesis/type III secretory pathway chaperone